MLFRLPLKTNTFLMESFPDQFLWALPAQELMAMTPWQFTKLPEELGNTLSKRESLTSYS